MTNELTDVRCSCGDEYPADSYDAGFIAGSGMCQNCDAALPPKDICTCPSGDSSLRHPCPAHPASVDLAGVAAKLTFINGRPAMCGCQVEYSSGGGEYSDVIDVTLCAKHSGSAILDLVATNRIALTPEYEGQWHADLYLDREIPLAKAEGATPAEAVLALMSAERIDPEQESVGQAGGDERAAFFKHLIGRHPAHETEIVRVVEHNYAAWKAWQARAALAQPSPVSEPLIYACKSLAQITSSDGSGHADIAMAVLRMAGVCDDERERLVNEWKAAHAWKPSPAQAEQAEAERPEVVGYRVSMPDEPELGHWFEEEAESEPQIQHHEPLMTVAQHERIVGALRAKADQLREALEWRKENQAGQRELLRSVTAERDAALAKLAELENQEPFYYFADCDDPDYSHLFYTRSDALTQVADHGGSVVELFRLPVVQAQHSVPEGYRLIRLEHFAAIKAQLNPEQVDAYRGRNIYDEDKVYANWNAYRSALDEIKDVFQQIDWDTENELADLLAAAPGKEGL